ncbi:MAG: ATPase [Planctomycetaceae bacterium]
MIDSAVTESRPEPPPRSGDSESRLPPADDLYDDLFSGPDAEPAATPAIAAVRSQVVHTASAPQSPTTLKETGLSLMYVIELILKHLYLHGNLLGVELARQVRLPFQVVDEMLRYLKDERCIEVASGELIGPASYRFNLTELGRNRAREAFEQCRYVGPAPVTLEDYVAQCRKQAVSGISCNSQDLLIAFHNLVIRDGLLDELGPAVCSGKSIFLYGPPGNGKTMIAKGLGSFLNRRGGEIHVPYAIAAENSLVTVYDPTIHTATDEADDLDADPGVDNPGEIAHSIRQETPDRRWRRVRRPVVMTGGELTLEMLDLRYNKASNFYTAPLHIKANCGVFLIDDFGRQIVSPRDLLNRWILPLEEHVDYLTLATGKKFAVPFEQLTLFSTNLDPRELVDEAFLRRIRHKIKISSPDRGLFTEIFKLNCTQRKIPFRESAVDHLYKTYYDQGKPPRSSDPRDLLEIVQSICRFRDETVELTDELVAEATAKFFCKL